MTIKKYILLSISTLVIAGCTSEDISNAPSDERIPLRLEATLSSGSAVTRAVGNQFENDDKLLSYVEHVSSTDNGYSVVAGTLAGVVAFSKTTVEGKDVFTPAKALYWDDYSQSTDDNSKDLSKTGHGLRSYYGYCYNGRDPEPTLEEATGVLSWTISADQSSATSLKHNDLLWSETQAPVTYVHGQKAADSHGTLTVPFTHAMSKFTIVVVAGDGFKADDLDKATVTLSGMNKTGAFTAPSATVTATETTTVKMYGNAMSTTDEKPSRAYEAVAVPLTALTKDNLLATISNVAGNDYKVYITENMLTSWKDGITDGKSISGVNYKLTVSIKKQAVNVVATLANWTDVSATGSGEIQFTADVTNSGKSNDTNLKDGDSFSLWMAKKGDEKPKETDFGSIATTSEYSSGTFVNDTKIYWPNGSDYYYFRALAKTTDTKTLEAVTDKKAAQGTDLLWGTTAAHTAYAEGAAINPRTGDVPLVFKHAMSNVVINLTTTTDASQVDLTGAKVTLTNLYTDGTINIATGVITPNGSKVADAVPATTEYYNLIMIPQGIADVENVAKLIVTLSDGTTYSLQLNKCEDSSQKTITTWASGNKYTYTITLQKEAVKFRALVEDWKDNTGSGNATLDWD